VSKLKSAIGFTPHRLTLDSPLDAGKAKSKGKAKKKPRPSSESSSGSEGSRGMRGRGARKGGREIHGKKGPSTPAKKGQKGGRGKGGMNLDSSHYSGNSSHNLKMGSYRKMYTKYLLLFHKVIACISVSDKVIVVQW
jgi:hypothetical protein